MERLTDTQFLKHIDRCLLDLTKNAAHSFGIDFAALNEASIETHVRMRELGLEPLK